LPTKGTGRVQLGMTGDCFSGRAFITEHKGKRGQAVAVGLEWYDLPTKTRRKLSSYARNGIGVLLALPVRHRCGQRRRCGVRELFARSQDGPRRAKNEVSAGEVEGEMKLAGGSERMWEPTGWVRS
jgi:hypothetical protein